MNAAGQSIEYGVVPREIAAQVSGLEFLQGILGRRYPAPPITQVADFWLSEVESGRVVFEGVPSFRFYNPLGTVHGGWISTLLDSAMGCAAHTMLSAGQGYTTVDLTVSFVRPVLESSGKLRCEGKVIHAGGRIATAEGRLWDAKGTLVAHGSETCLILAAAGKPA
ncbi:MAG: PaaI family thioesterase [Bacteroidota bacterium]